MAKVAASAYHRFGGDLKGGETGAGGRQPLSVAAPSGPVPLTNGAGVAAEILCCAQVVLAGQEFLNPTFCSVARTPHPTDELDSCLEWGNRRPVLLSLGALK
jgi:hypothetical protein